jgi:formamidopyrimidine-DNA glycosylase
MPELPDITVYLEALERRVVGRVLERIRLADVFVLRTAIPPIDSLEGRRVIATRRMGKRIALGFDDDRWLIIHLMIAGRLHWTPSAGSGPPAKLPGRNVITTFLFENGALTLTEAGTKRRASLHVVEGETALRAHDPGGIDVFACSLDEFAAALTRRNHTLKRALTDPHLFSGIGPTPTKSCTPPDFRRSRSPKNWRATKSRGC